MDFVGVTIFGLAKQMSIQIINRNHRHLLLCQPVAPYAPYASPQKYLQSITGEKWLHLPYHYLFINMFRFEFEWMQEQEGDCGQIQSSRQLEMAKNMDRYYRSI